MKKLICFVLAFIMLISMTACGSKQDNSNKNDNTDVTDFKAPDLTQVFEAMKNKLPADLTVFENERAFDAYGVDPADCKQEIVASLYATGAPVELWLIEAVDEDALARVKEMAEARLLSLCEQLSSYDAAAYDIVVKGKVYTEGNCLLLIAASNAEELYNIYTTV